jgi:FkbM family methyltransferase
MKLVALLPKAIRGRAAEYLRARGLVTRFDRNRVNTIWIDVGANLGQSTLSAALENPRLLVFAFEPNWDLARQIMGRAANFVVLPIAASDKDGIANFFINAESGSHSLMRLNHQNVELWNKGAVDFSVSAEVPTPTIRIDTFMRLAKLERIDFLKVDAEGADLKVIQSAGDRLKHIRKIKAEVEVLDHLSYSDSHTKSEMIEFMKSRGFALTDTEEQNAARQQNLTFLNQHF